DDARHRIPRHLHELVRHSGFSRDPGPRHSGSRFIDSTVNCRKARTARPYIVTAADDMRAPGGSSMRGMNLSGKPGMVQPMQIPPTLGQPPTPFIQPRLGTLHWTTGPQHPSLTMQDFWPYAPAKSACS